MPEPAGGLLTPLPAGTGAESVPSGSVRGNEKHPPGQEKGLAMAGALAPALSIGLDGVLAETNGRESTARIPANCAIAKRICGEMKSSRRFQAK